MVSCLEAVHSESVGMKRKSSRKHDNLSSIVQTSFEEVGSTESDIFVASGSVAISWMIRHVSSVQEKWVRRRSSLVKVTIDEDRSFSSPCCESLHRG